MEKLAEFVQQHIADDLAKLIFNREKWQDVDVDLAVNCIESRRKLKGKVPEWYGNPELLFPLKLSAEQCSSTQTGNYKATLAGRIAGEDFPQEERNWKIADLTGGLGVDSWCFSKRASQVLYCEMQKPLCDAAEQNFKALGADNIIVRNSRIALPERCSGEDKCGDVIPVVGSIPVWELLDDFSPDIVYMDPARRRENGRKVFLIEECTPDVLTLKDELFRYCRHILLKLSPMADITMVCERLGKHCREVHVLASAGECKELLIWMDREWGGKYTITSIELRTDGMGRPFTFLPVEERSAVKPSPTSGVPAENMYLFEPGKALMKAGAFNLISDRFGICKMGVSTHYYVFDEIPAVTCDIQQPLSERLADFGKVYRILRCGTLDKRSLKTIGKDFPEADVTARNIPMDTDTLRKRLGVAVTAGKGSCTKSSGEFHIFGLKSDSLGNLLIVGQRCR